MTHVYDIRIERAQVRRVVSPLIHMTSLMLLRHILKSGLDSDPIPCYFKDHIVPLKSGINFKGKI